MTAKNFFKKNKQTLTILGIIFAVGIFLRTYEFHDWLRFSRDQVRDMKIIDNALSGKDHLPYLGPNAGVTKFRLGPIYYQFSYISEKIFGAYPDKMAYPSVLSSILAVPLLFLFLREYFNRRLSLGLTALASVSYFLIINSRFSSNPNLIPFFILAFLYSLLKLMDMEEKRKYLWGAFAGIALGVCVQLHTTLLIALPPMALAVFIYLWRKKTPQIWKTAFIVLIFTLILNSTQIFSEIDSGGKNTSYFFRGFRSSQNSSSHFWRNVFHISACQIQANSHTISAFGDDVACNAVFYAPPDDMRMENYKYYTGICLSVIFSIVGYFLLFKYFRREKDLKKKHFLGIVILFNFLSFIILVPIAKIIFVGYFINLFVVPLVLLGLLFLEIEKLFPAPGKNVSAAILVVLIVLCFSRDLKTAESYMNGWENNERNSTLGEVESIYRYILADSTDGFSKVHLGGQHGLAERFFRPVDYFTRQKGIETALLKQDGLDEVALGSPVFYLGRNAPEDIPTGQKIWGREIIKGEKFSGLTVFKLKN